MATKNNIYILEPCCIHKQLHEIVQNIKADNATHALAYHFGDCYFKAFAFFAADFAAKSNIIITLPSLCQSNAITIADIAKLTFRCNAHSQLQSRFDNVRIITHQPSNASLDILKDIKNCYVADYKVNQSAIIVYNSKMAISIVGAIPDNAVSCHSSFNLVTLSTQLPFATAFTNTLLPIFKNHQIKL